MTSVPRLSHDDSDTNIASETAQKNTSYLTGVNGLRALGIIAVILYHLRPTSPAPGGFIGVTLFFVISGFLVTFANWMLKMRSRLDATLFGASLAFGHQWWL